MKIEDKVDFVQHR